MATRGLANSRWAASSTWRSSPLPSFGRTSASKPAVAAAAAASAAASAASASPTPPPATNGTANAPSARGQRTPSPAAELLRYTKIVRRLKWKLPFLAHGYRQATLPLEACTDEERAQIAEAELMFKLDFFEYYMLIERALVHLLGVFGITVSRDFAERHLQALLGEQKAQQQQQQQKGAAAAYHGRGPSPLRALPRSAHRYHANVLEALDNPDNPLHEALGMGDVRRQLGRAKDLRNRWKNADEGEDPARRAVAPLESYDLERILETIFEGFDRGYVIADRFVLAEQQRLAETGAGDMIWDTDEQQWEFMVDAMDWEAV